MKRKADFDHGDADKKTKLDHQKGASEDQDEEREETFTNQDYTVGWICALPIELAAAQAMRDGSHGAFEVVEGDTNSYVLGRVAAHLVVMTCLPHGTVGTNVAATVATNMLRTFPRLRFILLVGVGAGAPDPDSTDADTDIRLGDVVVSKPSAKNGGVIQYDFGKTLQSATPDNVKTLNKPPAILRAAVTRLEASHIAEGSKIDDILQATYRTHPRIRDKFQHPGEGQDLLFEVDYEHVAGQKDCRSCELQSRVVRESRATSTPIIHYGLIASANQVMRSALVRERIRKDQGTICFEMEAAGIMDDCPCLVVRGICDYADSHKNKQWQPYAALTAAAYAKELLQSMQASSVNNAAAVTLISDILREQIDMTREHHQDQHLRYQSDRHEACHRIFGSSDYERHKNLNPDAVPGTCRWALDCAEYHEWSTSANGRLLWITADPGCGKSVLSKSLVDHWLRSPGMTAPSASIESADASVQPHTICYFFFKDNDEQSGLATALCALLHQLFSQQPDLIRHALPAFKQNKEDALTKKVDELWRILQLAVNDVDAQPVVCVLDALDECRDGDRGLLVDLLCQSHEGLPPTSRHGSLKWLVTSRPHEDIEERLNRWPDVPTIRLRGEDQNDQIREEINLVIRHHMRNLGRQLRLNEVKRDEVTQQLLEMENRTYLWLHLVLDHINMTFQQSARPNQVRILSLPKTVYQAYEDILKRIQSGEAEQYARKILTIIIGARRPLTVAEMATAFDVATLSEVPKSLTDLTVDAGRLREKVRHWCGLFVFVNHDRLYLLHQTAKEFLLSRIDQVSRNDQATCDTRTGRWQHCLHPLSIERDMARICVSFLSLPEFNSDYKDTSDPGKADDDEKDFYNFFVFASEHWADHVRIVEADLDDLTQSNVRALYDASSKRFGRWISIMWKANPRLIDTLCPTNFDMSPLHLASFLGHYRVVEWLLSKEPLLNLHIRSGNGHTPLLWAAEAGHESVVKVLLDAGADNIVQGAFGIQKTALHSASLHGHEKVVEMLIAAGANVNTKDASYGQPLLSASARGHERVVQVLIAAGADVNASGGFDGTDNALYVASGGGYEKVVQTLLDAGANVNAQGGHFGCALHAAVGHGNERVVQTLINAAADVDAQGRHGSALYIASLCGNERIVQLLLDANANVNAGGEKYKSALYIASVYGNENIVQMLIDAGADISARAEKGEWREYGPRDKLSLHTIVSSGQEEELQTLIANINCWR